MGLLTPLAIRIGHVRWLPKVLPQIVWVDIRLQRLSRGRLTLLDIAGLPNLLLTVNGRKTGLPRDTPLLCVLYKGAYLVAGSNFGGPTEPAWAHNLEAALKGTVRVRGVTRKVTARVIHGRERELMWDHMVRTWPNFVLYQERTDRLIKVYELSPEPVNSDPPVPADMG